MGSSLFATSYKQYDYSYMLYEKAINYNESNSFKFQITNLVHELDSKKAAETTKRSVCQTSPLLRKPLLKKCMLVFTIQFCALLGWAFFSKFPSCIISSQRLIDLLNSQSQYGAIVATSTVFYGFGLWKLRNVWR